MRKLISLCLIVVLFLCPLAVLASDVDATSPTVSQTEDTTQLIANAKSGMLIEASTRKILFEKNSHEQMAVASMTKMMAQILILEAIENGNLSWDEQITVSSNAAGMGGSQIWLEPNEVMSVRDLMKGISMGSANDATVALAERLGGTEEGFVAMMNEKAKEMGLTETNFTNSTGLDEDNHYSSAHDMGMIALELLKHEQILEFSSVYEDYLRKDTANPFWLVNTNKLIRTYQGADGLKTGHTDNALYCMAVTAKKNNMRLIAIVLGEADSKVRNQETAALLDYGFNLYQIQLVKAKGEVLGELHVPQGEKQDVEIVALQDIGILAKKNEKVADYQTELQLSEVKLPLKVGDVVGKVTLKLNGEVVGEYPVTVKEDVNKTKLGTLYWRILEKIFTGESLS